MDHWIVRELEQRDKQAFLKAMKAPWEEGFKTAFYFNDLARGNYEQYLEILESAKMGEKIPSEHVPSTHLFAFHPKTAEIVGRANIRHKLDSFLENYGGNIGYVVDPKFRRQGVAHALLQASIKYCSQQLGIKKILVTCNPDNLGSIAVIEKSGGKFIDQRESSLASNIRKNRYHIESYNL